MPTVPIFAESVPTHGPLHIARTPDAPDELSNRLHRLETEVTELRDTIARFADIMIGEVKDLKKAHHEMPMAPPSIAGRYASETNDMPVAETSAVAPPTESTHRRPWLLMEMIRDLGSTFRMYLDPRYRVRRATQLMVPLILGLFAFNCYVFNFVFTLTFVSNIFEKLFDVVLAILLYQVMHREVIRYRSVIAQLTAWQQYRAQTMIVGSEPAMTPLETE
jgi:hypothetical protein